MKRVAFFNNKGGVGQTTLVYHVAHMLVDQGQRVLLLDMDPQSNLTAHCLDEERLEELWSDQANEPRTILDALQRGLRGGGDAHEPHVEDLGDGLAIVPGDIGLYALEEELADAWVRSLDGNDQALRTLSAIHRIVTVAAERHHADVVLFDVARGLGAMSRAALLAADFMITPLAPDLYSLQGLRALGPALRNWRTDWTKQLARASAPEFAGPALPMRPLGYVVMQSTVPTWQGRALKAYDQWLHQIPVEYHRSVLAEQGPAPTPDPWCLGTMRNYHSLVLLAQDARKPIFHLKPANGAIGARMDAVLRCREDFERLSTAILARADELSAQAP
ncbi:ParA family protein [Polyangium fumosum]|uniref:ParA family protein n=1 Tax=Polyangium fumosum TaxID=889272 RepID=A0A4U1JEZ6_9BACT|nr:ParA family protein [Polyangium fumosum]TKD08841.1 ParA family protein [Polyangium fumosum]